MDAMVGIWASANTKFLSGVDPKKQALSRKAQFKLMKRFSERAAQGQLNWVGTLYPTQAAAQDVGMSLTDYEDFVYGACLIEKKDPIAEWRKAISVVLSRPYMAGGRLKMSAWNLSKAKLPEPLRQKARIFLTPC
jgi:leucyl aminopeptidase (aminopeptidase T)